MTSHLDLFLMYRDHWRKYWLSHYTGVLNHLFYLYVYIEKLEHVARVWWRKQTASCLLRRARPASRIRQPIIGQQNGRRVHLSKGNIARAVGNAPLTRRLILAHFQSPAVKAKTWLLKTSFYITGCSTQDSPGNCINMQNVLWSVALLS